MSQTAGVVVGVASGDRSPVLMCVGGQIFGQNNLDHDHLVFARWQLCVSALSGKRKGSIGSDAAGKASAIGERSELDAARLDSLAIAKPHNPSRRDMAIAAT